MTTLTRPLDPGLWRDDFFPPLSAWRILARVAGMVSVLLVWILLAGMICVGLIRLGFTLEMAALVGVPTPPLLVMLLNMAGVFNRPRGNERNLKAFRQWIAGPAGQRYGLAPEHLARLQPQGHNTLTVEVTPAWLEQPADKRLADLNHWYVVWDFCRDDGADRVALELTAVDSAGQTVGGSSSRKHEMAVWVVGGDRPDGPATVEEAPAGPRVIP